MTTYTFGQSLSNRGILADHILAPQLLISLLDYTMNDALTLWNQQWFILGNILCHC